MTSMDNKKIIQITAAVGSGDGAPGHSIHLDISGLDANVRVDEQEGVIYIERMVPLERTGAESDVYNYVAIPIGDLVEHLED